MYFFLPTLFSRVHQWGRHAAWRIFLLWCAAIVLIALLWQWRMDVGLIKFFPCFLPGVLAYCQRHAGRSFSPRVLFGTVGAAALIYPAMVGLGVSATLLSWPICLLLGLLLPRCREVQLPWMRRAGQLIARYSYGIYLLHVPMLYLAFHHLRGVPAPAAWLLFVAGVGVLAYGAHHLIEKPGIECGRTLVQRLLLGRAQSWRHR